MMVSLGPDERNSPQRKKWTHPECGPGEVYLWNMYDFEFDALEYESKRKGVTCLSIKSMRYTMPGVFPVFISDADFASYTSKNKKAYESYMSNSSKP